MDLGLGLALGFVARSVSAARVLHSFKCPDPVEVLLSVFAFFLAFFFCAALLLSFVSRRTTRSTRAVGC